MTRLWHHIEGSDFFDFVMWIEVSDIFGKACGITAHIEDRRVLKFSEVFENALAEAFTWGIDENDVRFRPMFGPLIFEIHHFKRRIESVVLRDIFGDFDRTRIEFGAEQMFERRDHASEAPRTTIEIPEDIGTITEPLAPQAVNMGGHIGIELCETACREACFD